MPNLKTAGVFFLVLYNLVCYSQFDKYPRTDYDKDWKYVYKDSLGNVLFGKSFDRAEPFMKGVAVVQKKIGEEMHSSLIDKKGKVIVPFAHQTIRNQLNGLLEISTQEGTRIITGLGKELAQCANCVITYYNNQRRFSMHPYGYHSRKHFKNPLNTSMLYDFKGKKLFESPGHKIIALTDILQFYPEQKRDTLPYYVVSNNRGNFRGIYDVVAEDGKVVLDSLATYYHELNFMQGIMAVSRNGKDAILDRQLKEIIPFDAGYDFMYEMQKHPEGRVFSARKNGKYGAVNLKNEILVPFKYTYALTYDPQNKVYFMSNRNQDSSWTFSPNGDTINAPGFVKSGDKMVLAPASIYTDQKTRKIGFLDNRSRAFIIPPVYDYLSEPINDTILFFRGDTAGFMNVKGKKIFTFPIPCYAASRFYNNRSFCILGLPEGKAAKATKPNTNRDSYRPKYVWIDKKGEIINAAVFDSFAKYENGKAMVSNEGESYFVDTNFKRVKFKGRYDYYSYFRKGFAVIGEGAHKYGMIDEKGNIVVPVVYDGIAVKPEQDLASIYRGIPDGVPLTDQTGKQTSSNGLTYVPDIIDGSIKVTKDETTQRLTLPGFTTTVAEPDVVVSDTLAEWYNYNNELLIDRIEREHIPLDGKEVTMIPFREDSLFGFVDKNNGQWIIKPRFKEVFAVYQEGAIVKIDDSYGMVDPTGKILFTGYNQVVKERNLFHGMNFSYSDTLLPEQYRMCLENAYYSKTGKLLFQEKAHNLSSFSDTDSLAYFRYGKTYRIRGESGAIYKNIRLTSVSKTPVICNNLFIYKSVINSKVHYSGFDARNKLKFQLPLNFDRLVGPFQISANLFGFVAGGGIYFVNEKGVNKPYGLEERSTSLTPDNYFNASQFVVKNFNQKKYGVINRKGEVIIPFQFKWMGDFVNGYALYADSLDRYGFVNLKGEKFPEMTNRETMEMAFMLGKQPSFYDSLTFLKVHCPPKEFKEQNEQTDVYSEEEEKQEPVCVVYFNLQRKMVFDLKEYSLSGYFNEGLAPVIDMNGNIGFINKKGEVVIKPEYEASMAGSYPMPYIVVPEFKNGFAYIKSWKGYIDKTGKKYFSGIQLKDHYDFSH